MVTQYAFFVNSDACSGCKTCQVACKDARDIPAGLHWRRVIEVTAGGWQQKDGAWLSTVIAYNLSVACHHCFIPACARSCQGDAIWKRDDGIVLIDDIRCTRCRQCEADCPYGAIRWDGATNTEYKCDFCVDAIDSGGTPACVAACPNRALEFGELSTLRARHGDVQRVFPLPDPAIADPALVVKPHRHAALASTRGPQVVNWEEL
jgi:anaerobic dimethyl sulfoxide reductase subunit B (iron-sulfur subunit)